MFHVYHRFRGMRMAQTFNQLSIQPNENLEPQTQLIDRFGEKSPI